jgi:glycosyltransferase involved in cell wall biosynthesis
MTNQPLVSVIITTYNRAHMLKGTIDSIIGQTYHNIELIIVSDASTDNTDEIVSPYIEERIRYIKLPKNTGLPAETRNKGLEEAKGEYIAFCDDDDLWMPEKLKKQIQAITINDSDLCFTNTIHIDKNSNTVNKRRINIPIPQKATLSRLLLSNYVTLSSVLVKHEVVKKFKGFDTRSDFRAGEDYELWGRMLAEGVTFCSVNENLVLYRVHDRNISQNLEIGIKRTIKINRHLFRTYNLPKQIIVQTEIMYFLKLIYYKLKGLKSIFHQTLKCQQL